MATRRINLPLDEELIRRARQQDIAAPKKSDAQVVEDALAVYLGMKARGRKGRCRRTRPTASRSRKSGQFARRGAVAPREACRRRPERPRLGVPRQPRRRPRSARRRVARPSLRDRVSPLLLAELGEVLERPKFQRWTGADRGAAYVAAFAAQGERHVDPEDDAGGHVRDADDDYLVALAQTARVDAIVALDRDLLDARLDWIAVVDPARFLSRL